MGFVKLYFRRYADYAVPFVIFLITFIFYFRNLSPYIYGGDSGDLLLAVGVKGIAHPSGYPLFTLLGILFSFLPINQTLAFKVGLLSAFFSSLSAFFLYLISFALTKDKMISFISSLTLAFSYIFWLYAEVVEVFALASFFILLLIYLALLFYEKKTIFYLYLISFFAGLSLSHHLVVLSVLPFLLVIILRRDWKIIFNYKSIIKCFFLFLLGLLPYIYIPIAASHYPVYSWDNAVNLKNFIHLVTRADYSWGISTIQKGSLSHSLNMRFFVLLKYFTDLFYLITPFVLGVSILGIFNLICRRRFFILFSFLSIYILLGPFFVFYSAIPNLFNYTMGVVERFYVFSLIFIAIFFSLGCSFAINLINKIVSLKKTPIGRIKFYGLALYLIFLIIPVYLLIANFKATDFSNASAGEEVAKDYLRDLPLNSFLFISGDTATLNIWYVQHILGFRKDIRVINSQVPNLDMKFVNEIYPEFQNNAKSFFALKSRINKKILENYRLRFTFSGYGAVGDKEKGVAWVPFGLSQKMIIGSFNQDEKSFIRQTDELWEHMNYKKFNELTEAEKKSQILSTVQSIYSQAAFNTGVFLMKQYASLEEAKKYFELADEISPTENLGKWGLANYYFSKKECRKSDEIMQKIQRDNPMMRNSYIYRYLIYKKCFNDKIKIKQIEEKYMEIFKEKFPKSNF